MQMNMRLGLVILLTCLGCAQSTPEEAETRTDRTPDEQPAVQPEASALDTPIPKVLSDEEVGDGWIALFDGHTLFGWQPTSRADWRVEDGEIRVGEGEPGLLLTPSQFSDYILKADFKCPADTNSGLFLHTMDAAGPRDVAKTVYELNIAGQDNPFPTGSLVGRQKAQPVDPSDNNWRTFEVRIEGDQVHVQLDGEEVLKYTDPQPLGRGYIGLQLNQGDVAFRNVKLKPLGLDEVFNGRDLSGWNTAGTGTSEFSVTDEGELRVVNGPGHLESDQQYGDFIFQLECKTNERFLNSGIFFRCIPGEKMNGYESQIHNEFLDGDRTDPKDYGTGAIFRRQKARRVVADDLEWFAKTIIAHGPHMAVWVNGYQVTDWTDEREPHDNPRQGLRTAPGTFMIQGHDPTTDVSFRDLHAGEMRNRLEATDDRLQ